MSPTALATSQPRTAPVFFLGDSVMLSGWKEVKEILGNPEMDGEVSRQVFSTIELLRERVAAGKRDRVVIIHVGNNGVFTARQFDEIMEVLSGTHRVVFVNVKAPRHWESRNNAVLADGVKRYPNTRLADWYGASHSHPEYFRSDGIHLVPDGAKIYANVIATQVSVP